MYCCCTTHESSEICDDIPKFRNTSKTSKMDQANAESNTVGNSGDVNESTVLKDCDTNSEHSSLLNESSHSSYNNRYCYLV